MSSLRAPSAEARVEVGPIGRLGRWTATHVRLVVIVWALVAVGLGALAPWAEHALSGAGWEASGSESVAAREAINGSFGGQGGYAMMVVVHGPGNLDPIVADATRILEADESRLLGRPTAGLQGRSHRDRQRRRCRRPDRDGAGRGRPEGQARRPLGQPDERQSHRRPGHVVGLQRGQQERHVEVGGHLLAGDARDPPARVRLAGRRGAPAPPHDSRADGVGRKPLPGHTSVRRLDLVDELRAHVRARARDRLRALHRRPLPRRPLRLAHQDERCRGGDNGHGRQGRALLGRHRACLVVGGDARAEPRIPLDGARDHALRRVHPARDADAAPRGARLARRPRRPARAAMGPRRRAPLATLRPLGRAPLATPRPARPSRARGPRAARPARAAARYRHALDQGRPRGRRVAHRLCPGTGGVRAGRPRHAAGRRAGKRGSSRDCGHGGGPRASSRSLRHSARATRCSCSRYPRRIRPIPRSAP